MVSIASEKILQALQDLQVSYTLQGKLLETYVVASLFEPIDHGFYFITSQEYPLQSKNSLALVPHGYSKSNESNSYLLLTEEERDVQQIYYLVLSSLFARKSDGIISEWTEISPFAKIGNNVQIDSFSSIGEATIGDNVIIGRNVEILDNSIIGDNTIIESGSIIGAQGVAWVWNQDQTSKIRQPQLGGVEIGNDCFLGAQTIVVRGSLSEKTTIGDHTMMAPGCRLGHGTKIGNHVHLANNVTTGGNTLIGDFSFIGSGAIFRPKCQIHNKTIVGSGAVVTKNTTEEGKTLIGSPAREHISKPNPTGMPKPKK